MNLISVAPSMQKVAIIQKVKDVLVPSLKRHKIIVGGRGKGASWSIARVLLLEGMQEPLFIACVREVQKTIKYSVYKLLEDTIATYKWDWFYAVGASEIVGKNGTKFVFFGMQEYNADNVKSLEGADRCWVAEAQSISRRSVNVLRPTIRKEGAVFWWDFNPRYEVDPVYVDYILNKDANAEVLWLSFEDNPWFTNSMKMEMESDYARNADEADHIWKGALRNMGDKYVCPSTLVDVAMRNEILKISGSMIVVGADIAHQGGDQIIFYKRHGNKIIDQYISEKQDSIKTLRDLKAFAGDRSIKINIDNGDIGKAIADYLEVDNWIVDRVNFGGVPDDPIHYEDCASEMYFNLRDRLEYIDIPNDPILREQLIQRKYDYINGRRGYEVMKIESKDKFKDHAIGKFSSPDRADALVLCFYERDASGYAESLSYNIF